MEGERRGRRGGGGREVEEKRKAWKNGRGRRVDRGEDERAIIQLETLDSLLWCNGGI